MPGDRGIWTPNSCCLWMCMLDFSRRGERKSWHGTSWTSWFLGSKTGLKDWLCWQKALTGPCRIRQVWRPCERFRIRSGFKHLTDMDFHGLKCNKLLRLTILEISFLGAETLGKRVWITYFPDSSQQSMLEFWCIYVYKYTCIYGNIYISQDWQTLRFWGWWKQRTLLKARSRAELPVWDNLLFVCDTS